jgi:DNA-binding winged helix-turn-helix (wHTH) protein
MTATVYIFDNFRLVPSQWTLYQNDEPVKLEPKVIDALLYLVQESGRLVSKDELIAHVWPNVVVDDGSLLRVIVEVRKALNDVPPYRYIKNIRGRGYRFCAAVTTQTKSPNELQQNEVPQSDASSFNVSKIKKGLVFLIASAVLLSIFGVGVFYRYGRSPSPKAEFVAKQLTFNSRELPVLTAAISPDGNLIAFADQTGLFVSDYALLEHHSLTLPDGIIAGHIEWYPDNIHLLISAYNVKNHHAEVWKLSTINSVAKQLLTDATNATVSANGQRMAFIRDSTELWIAASDGSGSTRVAALNDNTKFVLQPQFSFDGEYLLNGRLLTTDGHPVIEARNISSGVVTRIYEFQLHDFLEGFVILPNYELLIARHLQGTEDNSVISKIRFNVEKPDASPLQLLLTLPHETVGFTTSHDGERILFINAFSESDVYVADVGQGGAVISNPRRLTLTDTGQWPSGWLGDAHTVLFQSKQMAHKSSIYKQSINSQKAEAVVVGEHEDFRGVVDYSQQWLFYFEIEGTSLRLMRQRLSGGLAEMLDARQDAYRQIRCAAHANVCVLANYDDHGISFIQVDPKNGIGDELARVKWVPTYNSEIWDISPDGTRIAYINNIDHADSIELFDLASTSRNKTSIHVVNNDPLRSLFWDAEGRGFYVSAYDTSGRVLELLHVSLEGSTHILRTQATSGEGWAIPSPDGKHLAYQQWTQDGNIWMLQRQD